ncbi:MAG: AAA+ family ATPase [Phormidesmis priestleyi]|uniref:AAA+ family ATPase n=1 Tax=Phormidesmis priestleyi TaxID=268141 RepID=A0A2W4WLF0_9CYAN|nr:MAG: AAA+ family ATPase [Phormidesmis priestleyi]
MKMRLEKGAIATIQSCRQQAASLLLYQSVIARDAGQAFTTLLTTIAAADQADQSTCFQPEHALACSQAYGRWFSALALNQQSWQQHLVAQILGADNAFSRQVQSIAVSLGSQVPASLLAAVNHDMSILRTLYQFPLTRLSQWMQQICGGDAPFVLPIFDNFRQSSLDSEHASPVSFRTVSFRSLSFLEDPQSADAPEALADYYQRHGVGIFGQFTALRWQINHSNASNDLELGAGELVGIPNPDPIRLKQLAAYEHPKQQLVQNTEALLQGYSAQNVLLYGSRGSGKSSLVKALLNEYSDRHLRLIEEDDEAFKSLKVVLEGGVTARPQNVVVYATSNRRHLIREFFDERPSPKDAEEIQAWDTVQEKLSFSDRFGLTLTFTPADQPTYLTIVHELAAQAALTIDPENLDWRARQWATRHNGRSGRSARQFVDFLIAEEGGGHLEPEPLP